MTGMNNQEAKAIARDIARKLPAGSKMSWWNYITEEYDHLPAGIGKHFTVKGARQYIPQTVPSLGIFDCHIALGEKPIDAIRLTLEAHVQEEKS